MDLAQVLESEKFSGDGPFSDRATAELSKILNGSNVLLTHSCTAALEMAVLLTNICPGDEVIVPSYTFVSTANCVVQAGGVPVFVDVDPVSFSLSVSAVSEALTSRTRAIIVVHYGGSCGDIIRLSEFAKSKNIYLIEDAAQSLGASFQDQPLGTFGDFGCFSFHETKNIHCGEGGAIVIKSAENFHRAEIIREKGTNRSSFFRNEVNKYTWIDKGSSYLPSEFNAAFLYGQLLNIEMILSARKNAWEYYYSSLEYLANSNEFLLPRYVSSHNAHIFYLLFESESTLVSLKEFLGSRGVLAITHYVPLHDSPGGIAFGRSSGDFVNTNAIASGLLRLPLFTEISKRQMNFIISSVEEWTQGYKIA